MATLARAPISGGGVALLKQETGEKGEAIITVMEIIERRPALPYGVGMAMAKGRTPARWERPKRGLSLGELYDRARRLFGGQPREAR